MSPITVPNPKPIKRGFAELIAIPIMRPPKKQKNKPPLKAPINIPFSIKGKRTSHWNKYLSSSISRLVKISPITELPIIPK